MSTFAIIIIVFLILGIASENEELQERVDELENEE